jgi:N-acyl homoserine lactone hydrolase
MPSKLPFAQRLGLALTCAAAFTALPAAAQTTAPTPELTLARLDCGTPVLNIVARFNDAWAFTDNKVLFTYSCYLIKRGDEYMLWDTGHAMTAGAPAPKVSIVDQLAQINVKPEQIKYVGISHYHADHTGQVASFPGATLLIGKGDWDGLTAPTPNAGAIVPPFTHWISGGGKLEALPGDKDVFGDGSVFIMKTPGHTPGHSSLLVRLKDKGPVLITGDLSHFQENYDSNGVPTFNFHRGDTLASLDRFKKTAANLKATVIIQHDARDVGKLPAWPAAAK